MQHVQGPVTNPENTAYIIQSTGSMNLNSSNGGLYWTHLWDNGAYADLVSQVSFYNGRASSTRTSLSLDGFGVADSLELGYPLKLANLGFIEPQGQLLYTYDRFDNKSDYFSRVDLGSANALLGRAGVRLTHPVEINQYPVMPFLRTNFWSVLSGDRTSPVIYSGFDSIISSAASHWAQLGGGFRADITPKVNIYAYLDDLVNIGSNQNRLNGFDIGLGVHAFL